MTTYAVWSIHARAKEMVGGGYTIDGKTIITPGPPRETFDDYEAAEAWRLAKLEEWKHELERP